MNIKPFVAAFSVLLIGRAQSPGTFTPTGSMSAGRVWHTATLLNDGSVLIAGGRGLTGDNSVLASSELYDPRTGTFSLAGSMNTPRFSHAATLLRSGTVLITGGATGHDSMTSGAEVYHPVYRKLFPGAMAYGSIGIAAPAQQFVGPCFRQSPAARR